MVFVGRNIEWISGSDWPSFLKKQSVLLAKRTKRAKNGTPLVSAIIQLPDGRTIESVDASFVIRENESGPDLSGSGTQSGSNLSQDDLVWFNAPSENGSVTRIISFSNLISAPVKVTFVKGIPDKTNVVFEMKPR